MCFALLTSLAAAAPASAQSLQEVLLRAKPAVALVVAEVGAEVTVDCGTGPVTVTPPSLRETGSGWFVNPSGWMITSGRVAALAHEPPRWVEPSLRDSGAKSACLPPLLRQRGLSPGARPDVEERIARELAARIAPRARVKLQPSITVLLPNGMRLAARVAKSVAPSRDQAMSGRDLALLRVEAANMPTLPLGDAAQVRLGDRLHVIGFPDVVLTHELLNASAKAEASVTSGAVSGFKEDVQGAPVIQVDASATGGDSGGPAVNDRGEVIGVMAFVSRAREESVQGFNFIVPVSAVRDLVTEAGVAVDDPGAFNRAWRSALGAFFAGEHQQARRHLAEAERLVPTLPDVRRITSENEERIEHPPPRRYPWNLVGTALTAIGAVGCALAWTNWWQRNRFRVGPREAAALLGSTDRPPILLDVRDTETYRRSPVALPRALHLPVERLATGDANLPLDSSRAVIAYCT